MYNHHHNYNCTVHEQCMAYTDYCLQCSDTTDRVTTWPPHRRGGKVMWVVGLLRRKIQRIPRDLMDMADQHIPNTNLLPSEPGYGDINSRYPIQTSRDLWLCQELLPGPLVEGLLVICMAVKLNMAIMPIKETPLWWWALHSYTVLFTLLP